MSAEKNKISYIRNLYDRHEKRIQLDPFILPFWTGPVCQNLRCNHISPSCNLNRTIAVFENPCPTGNPRLGPSGRPVSCSSAQPCPPTFWCHLGAGPSTTTCCPNGLLMLFLIVRKKSNTFHLHIAKYCR